MIGYALFVVLMMQFWTCLDPWAIRQIWLDNYYIFVAMLMITYFYESKDFVGLAQISKWTLIFIIITAFFTIVTSYVMGSTARAMIFGNSAEAEETQKFFAKYGSGSYGYCIVFMSIISIVVYYYKNIILFTLKNRFAVIVVITLLLIAVLRLQLFTNVVFAFIVLLFSILNISGMRKFSYIIIPFIIVIAVIPQSFYISLLYDLSALFSGVLDEVSFKFKGLADYIQLGPQISDETGNYVARRAARFPLLLDGFLKFPIFGCAVSPISKTLYAAETGHLYWMFKLSMLGIVNFLFYLSIFVCFIKEQKRYLSREYFYYFSIAALSVLLYGVFKVTGGREAWYFIFVIAPGLYYLPLSVSSKSRYSIGKMVIKKAITKNE